MQASQEAVRRGTFRASDTNAWKPLSAQIWTRALLRSHPTWNKTQTQTYRESNKAIQWTIILKQQQIHTSAECQHVQGLKNNMFTNCSWSFKPEKMSKNGDKVCKENKRHKWESRNTTHMHTHPRSTADMQTERLRSRAGGTKRGKDWGEKREEEKRPGLGENENKQNKTLVAAVLAAWSQCSLCWFITATLWVRISCLHAPPNPKQEYPSVHTQTGNEGYYHGNRANAKKKTTTKKDTGKKWEQQRGSHPAVPYSYLFSCPEARRDVYTCDQKQTLC